MRSEGKKEETIAKLDKQDRKAETWVEMNEAE